MGAVSQVMVPAGYHTYEEIIALADSLELNFPSICKKVVYGTSIEGRQLAALKISDNAEDEETEPEVLFDGGCHGDEIGGPENLIRFARDLCIRYGTDPVITELVDTRETWLYLMVNPDGRVSMSRFNAAMVDLNRDYGYMWDASGGSTADFSQPETRAVRTCLLEHRFAVYVTYHSGLEQAAYPWAYRGDEPPDKSNLRRVAKAYSDSSLYPSLPYGQSYSIMYQASGMSIDYNYGTLGQACFTMELSHDKQPPDPLTYYAINYPAMLEMMRIAGNGVAGLVVDSATGEPVEATIWVDDFFPVYNEPTAGDFHKYLLPGTHVLKVTANGYKTSESVIFNVPQQGAAILNIVLSPGGGRYAQRVAACRIPDNNPADEGYTPGVLLSPDSIAYSVGTGGWIVIDLGDTIHDQEGDDLIVYEAGLPDEGFDCYCSNNPDGLWIALGAGTGTTAFDLSMAGSARYIKIVDDGDGEPNVPDAGFDLDAIAVVPDPWTSLPGTLALKEVIVYPNPSSGIFHISGPVATGGVLVVADLSGRIMQQKAFGSLPARLDLSFLAPGMYSCTIQSRAESRAFLLIKM